MEGVLLLEPGASSFYARGRCCDSVVIDLAAWAAPLQMDQDTWAAKGGPPTLLQDEEVPAFVFGPSTTASAEKDADVESEGEVDDLERQPRRRSRRSRTSVGYSDLAGDAALLVGPPKLHCLALASGIESLPA